MKRFVFLSGVLLSPIVAAQADAGAPCEWLEMKKPPELSEYRGGVELIFDVDPKGWQCAKREGGSELTLTFEVGEGEAKAQGPARAIKSWRSREYLPAKELCSTPGAKKVRAVLTGTGPLAKLSQTSKTVDVYCARCAGLKSGQSLALHLGPFLTPKGQWTVEASVDPEWHRCARAGSTLALHLFAGNDRASVEAATTPTQVVKGLEASPKIKRSF